MQRPFSVRIFVPSGDPEGIRIVTRDDWTGKGVLFPRSLQGIARGRKEYQLPGIYFLAGAKKIYVGEGDPVGPRLDSHANAKDFWSKAVFFVSEGRLHKAHIQHLESRLVSLLKANGTLLDNIDTPSPPSLSEEEQAFAEGFLADILLLLPLLGFKHFEKESPGGADGVEADDTEEMEGGGSPRGRNSAIYDVLPKDPVFHLVFRGGFAARLKVVDGGVVVFKGSQVSHNVVPSFEVHQPAYAQTRRQLIDSGVIAGPDPMCFTEDQFFTAASAASSVICGRVLAADVWETEDGRNLGDMIRDAKARLRASTRFDDLEPAGGRLVPVPDDGSEAGRTPPPETGHHQPGARAGDASGSDAAPSDTDAASGS